MPYSRLRQHDLVLQFGIFALQANSIQQVADTTGRPQAGYEYVVTAGFRKVAFIHELAPLPLHIAQQANGDMPATPS